MSRWFMILLFFGGLSLTSILSMRGVDRGASPAVNTMEDGSGFPTPKAP